MLRGIAQASLHEVGVLDHRHLQSRIGRSQGSPSDTPSANDAGSSGTLNRISINPIRQKTSIVITKLILLLGSPLVALLAASSLQSRPIDILGHPQQNAAQLVHKAELEVDHA
jgi:hypothetical protein